MTSLGGLVVAPWCLDVQTKSAHTQFLLQQDPTGCGSMLCFYHLIKLSMAFVSGR